MTQGLSLSGQKVSLYESKSSLSKIIREQEKVYRQQKVKKLNKKKHPTPFTPTTVASPYLKRLPQSQAKSCADLPVKPKTCSAVSKPVVSKEDPFRPKTSLVLSQIPLTAMTSIKNRPNPKPFTQLSRPPTDINSRKPPTAAEIQTVVAIPSLAESQKAEQLQRLIRRAKLRCLNDLLQSIERANFAKLQKSNGPTSSIASHSTLERGASVPNVHAV